LGPQCFCCTILRDVIFVEACSASVISTTCILQHAVVCWVTAPDPGEIWTVGLTVVALWLPWSELTVEEVTATSPNNFLAACCSLALAALAFPLRTPVGLGGKGSCGRSRASEGSGGSQSFSSARVRGAGGPLAVSAPPSSPLPAGLGGEGKGDLAGLHACSSVFFFKRGHYFPCCPAAAPVHLAGRGGEEVA
jgi:hypothetical protein